MKKLLLLTGLFTATRSCCKTDTYHLIQSTEVTGTVIGVSVETDTLGHNLKFFELMDDAGSTYKYRYYKTKLSIGDSIKFTTPKTDNPTDLGSIMYYGKSRNYGKVHKLY